jgi:hypothetical protein
MAKGNPFIGTLRGKLGDTVWYRTDGEQHSRGYVKEVRNPKSDRQLLQRAVFATVQQAYSAGYELFNHSFQGERVGSGNQRMFVKENIKELRNLFSAALSGHVTRGRDGLAFVAPGVNYPAPWKGMIISKGTYPQNLFSTLTADDGVEYGQLNIAKQDWIDAGMSTVGDVYDAGILVPGDIYTFAIFAVDTDVVVYDGPGFTSDKQQFACTFQYIQLMVNQDSDTLRAKVLDLSVKYSDIFSVYKTTLAKVNFMNQDISSALAFNDLLAVTGAYGTFGIIRSRLDRDLRSDSRMLLGRWPMIYGVSYFSVLDVWRIGATPLGESELILEGANFNVGEAPTPATPSIVSTTPALPVSSSSESTITVAVAGTLLSEELFQTGKIKITAGSTDYSGWNYDSENLRYQISRQGVTFWVVASSITSSGFTLTLPPGAPVTVTAISVITD